MLGVLIGLVAVAVGALLLLRKTSALPGLM